MGRRHAKPTPPSQCLGNLVSIGLTPTSADMRSSPDARGYLRDDNLLVESLPPALTIRGANRNHDAKTGESSLLLLRPICVQMFRWTQPEPGSASLEAC